MARHSIAGRDALKQFAPPEHGEHLECWRVSDAAKRPGNEGPELLWPLEDHAGLLLEAMRALLYALATAFRRLFPAPRLLGSK